MWISKPQNDSLPVIQASGSPVRRRPTSESRSSTFPPARARSSFASSSGTMNPARESRAVRSARSVGDATLAIGSREPRAGSGGPVVKFERSIRLRHFGGEPSAKLGAHPVEPPAEPVGIALDHVFQGQVRQLAPGETLQQVPGGAFDEVAGTRPEAA